ncbi:hypothetical protein Rsub_11710 [Raphidocelis subcapitata]|uniref:Uncharacterized protein n=1 Tax=Raphidocelis subcapitata TaxID=307507 RepID=A0A2V0PGD3_9CHLO|nr:hypothetical protein Rsub_11710 [Raphidocelis subcapitata]|eukprot:GBF98918.1 hypothetical protein Rsub_11710 [Raphidocelis subcapitata]
MSTSLQFAPAVAITGGAVLGICAAGKWLLTGRTLGISGGVKGWLTGDWKPWRLAFNGGLLAGGIVAGALAPAVFEAPPSTFTVARAALGGLLVGLGASLGNGCTSGHGICGNARLSPRSLAYTLLFMASGAAAATLTGTAAALGVADAAPQLALPPLGDPQLQKGAVLAALSVLSLVGLAAAAESLSRRAVALAAEAMCGFLFALGLTYTQMVRPAKVAAFLSPLSRCWDPSLMLTMGGALAVALPAFQFVKRSASAPAKPLAEECFLEPAASGIDARLVVGGLLFGAGWGLSGMCPGPALVSLVARLPPPPQVAAYCGAMAVGMAVDCAACGTLVCAPTRASKAEEKKA